jgi:hypothetical protein
MKLWVLAVAVLPLLLLLFGTITRQCIVSGTGTSSITDDDNDRIAGVVVVDATADGQENPTTTTSTATTATTCPRTTTTASTTVLPSLPFPPPSVAILRPECNLYMAESTIPGAGLGLFTTKSHTVGELLYNEEVYIPILELSWHQGKSEGEYFDTTDTYVWHGDSVGLHQEVNWNNEGPEEDDDDDGGVSGYWPGWGAAINCHFGLPNLDLTGYSYHEDLTQHRISNPGAGAYTYYHGPGAIVALDIPAGSELFLSYGDD